MYFCLDLQNVSSSAEEWLSHSVFDWDAQGMSEVLSFHQEEGEETVETVPTDEHHLHVYFEKCPDPAFMQELAVRFPEIKWRLLEESDQDWLAEWKKGFHSFPLVDGIYLVPSWLRPPEEAKQVIWMDPGMAFGTGTHETTQLVARALFKIRDQRMENVLDVGTGTGILAFLAKHLGAVNVVGIDTDPEALRVAAENAARNELSIHIVEKPLAELDGQFDIVLANIIDGVLVRIQSDIFQHMRKSGWLIVSGILQEREEHFLENFHLPPGAEWVERTSQGDWVCRVAKF
jgi:ribosomal protein L11 methyltransferase